MPAIPSPDFDQDDFNVTSKKESFDALIVLSIKAADTERAVSCTPPSEEQRIHFVFDSFPLLLAVRGEASSPILCSYSCSTAKYSARKRTAEHRRESC